MPYSVGGTVPADGLTHFIFAPFFDPSEGRFSGGGEGARVARKEGSFWGKEAPIPDMVNADFEHADEFAGGCAHPSGRLTHMTTRTRAQARAEAWTELLDLLVFWR